MSSTMSGYFPTKYILIAEYSLLHNAEHGTLNAERFNPINFQTLQTSQTLLFPQHGTRNVEHGTFLFFQKVRSQPLRSFHRLLMIPFIHLCLMAGQQYIRYFPSFIICRTGVYRWCQQVVLKRIAQCRLFIPDSTRYQAHDGIRHHGSG